jgi:hypothetical protein
MLIMKGLTPQLTKLPKHENTKLWPKISNCAIAHSVKFVKIKTIDV